MSAASRNVVKAKEQQVDQKGEDLSVVIPAAGIGRRMKSHGPKSLIHIKDSSIIERQIKLVHKYYPESEIIVVVGFGANLIREKIRRNKRNWLRRMLMRSRGMSVIRMRVRSWTGRPRISSSRNPPARPTQEGQ